MRTDSMLPSFPRLTRRERDILTLIVQDLSTNEIAEQLVVSVQTVRWYIKELYSKLDVHTREEAIAKAESLISKPPSLQVDSLHNLPTRSTTFVGRQQEIEAIRAALLHPDTRLLTLIGTAGMGKTRLSIEAAYTLLDSFPDGVTFISLAPLSDASLVAETTAKSLGLSANTPDIVVAALKNALRPRRALLIFDNFEHVLEATSLVSELLSVSPRLKVLATSREPLNLYGEQQYIVPPLSLMENATSAMSDAVILFAQRAKAVDAAFTLTPENTVIIDQICARLDGIPLAIELAAARIRLFPPPILLNRLDKRLHLLTGGARDLAERHRTLRSAIDWSYQLLDDDEKRLFRRLSVFAGGWTLEVLEGISTPELKQDVYQIFDSLIAKSMIKVAFSSDEDPRLYMLETLREFALEQLSETHELENARFLHASYFLELAKAVMKLKFDKESEIFMRKLDLELENLRLALDYFHQSDAMAEQEITMIAGLVQFWWDRSHLNEMISRGEAALSRDSNAIPPDLRAGLYLGLSSAYGGFYRNEEAVRYAEVGLALARRSEDVFWILSGLVVLAACNPLPGGNEYGIQLLQEALDLLPILDDPSFELPILSNFEVKLSNAGKMEQATKVRERAIMLSRQYGHHRSLAYALQHQSVVLFDIGDYAGAYTSAIEGLEAAQQIDHKRITFALLCQLADAEIELALLADAHITLDKLSKLATVANIPADLSTSYQLACSLAQKEGDASRTKTTLQQALGSGQNVDDLEFKLYSLLRFSGSFAALGDHFTAARLCGIVEHACQANDIERSMLFSARFNKEIEAIRVALGTETFARLQTEGASMSVEAGWALALAQVKHV